MSEIIENWNIVNFYIENKKILSLPKKKEEKFCRVSLNFFCPKYSTQKNDQYVSLKELIYTYSVKVN